MLMTSSRCGGFGMKIFSVAFNRERVLIYQTVFNPVTLSEILRLFKKASLYGQQYFGGAI
jgi:hypothetical protein